MLIKCPQCQTVFRLESEKLPESGLKMRCAKCLCVWRAYNDAVKEEEKEKTSADAPSFDTDAFRFAFSREEKKERTPPPDDRQEATAAGMPEDILSRPRQQKKTPALLLALLAAAAVAALGWHFRAQIERLPEKARPLTEQTIAPLLQKADPLLQKTGAFLQRLEDAFREQGPNLKINGLIWNYADKDGTPSIRLRGEVANPSEWLLNIPTMKIRLLDREGNLLRETDMAPERSMIAPGTNVKFEIDIDAPPQNVKQVLAYFEK